MYQEIAWAITIILVILVGLAFFKVFRSAGRREEYAPIIEKAYRIRKFYFIGLVTVMAIATVLSLTQLPYSGHQVEAAVPNAKVVDVKGYQYYWEFSDEEFYVGETIQFNVTSMDVTHGFGIYDENLILLAQTQAMPEYTNKVVHTFDKPGTYQILCLEYCSLGHHMMIKEIVVKERGGEK